MLNRPFKLHVKEPAKLDLLPDGTYKASHDGLDLVVHGKTVEEAAGAIVRAWDFMYQTLGPDRIVREYGDAVDCITDPKEVDLPEQVLEAI